MEDEQQVDGYRRGICMSGKADDARRRIARCRDIRVAVGRFQPGHEQGKHNADLGDQADQLSGPELIFRGLHRPITVPEVPRVQHSAYSNFHSLARVIRLGLGVTYRIDKSARLGRS